MKTLQQSSLAFQQGGSDKVYHIVLVQVEGGHLVNFQFGRRGSALQAGTKTPTPVTFEAAGKIFNKLDAEKRAKGYRPIDGGSVSAQSPVDKLDTGIYPHLLTEAEPETVMRLLADDNWCLQQKLDGKRILLEYSRDTPARAINRKGQQVAVSDHLLAELCDLYSGLDKTIIDGELVGDQYYVFDMLWHDGQDLTPLGYADRYNMLIHGDETWIADRCEYICLVGTASDRLDKAGMYERLIMENAEGAVFKKLDAPYVAGKASAKNATQFKDKFWHDVDVIVAPGPKAEKRSVSMWLHQGADVVHVGNVTIPSNCSMPQDGQVARVKYLYAYPNGGKLFQPQWQGVRDDKTEDECVYSQLVFKQGTDDEDDS